MADEYEVLSDKQINDVFAANPANGAPVFPWLKAIARGVERATIEAFRAKHLPELNQQKAYDIQRDELMAARVRIARLEALVRGVIEEDGEIFLEPVGSQYWWTERDKLLTTTAPQAAEEKAE